MLKDQLLNKLLQTTKDNPINRYECARHFGVHERTIRKAVKRLRDEGVRICVDGGGRGYWIAESEEDYKMLRRGYTRRCFHMSESVMFMDRFVPGQIKIDPPERFGRCD